MTDQIPLLTGLVEGRTSAAEERAILTMLRDAEPVGLNALLLGVPPQRPFVAWTTARSATTTGRH